MRVLIGIQARSTSERLPNKAIEVICGTPILGRVIYACDSAAATIRHKGPADVTVAVLTPYGDPIVSHFRDRAAMVEGPELDVLERYRMALDEYRPDYVVRITGDCPMIPSPVIVSHVLLAMKHEYDYFSNTDERFRTALDGIDCEVVSARLMRHTAEVAKRADDREHVTLMMRREPPSWAKIGVSLTHFDNSHVKLSVDTPEDLENVRREFDRTYSKYQAAVRVLGKSRVHRI